LKCQFKRFNALNINPYSGFSAPRTALWHDTMSDEQFSNEQFSNRGQNASRKRQAPARLAEYVDSSVARAMLGKRPVKRRLEDVQGGATDAGGSLAAAAPSAAASPPAAKASADDASLNIFAALALGRPGASAEAAALTPPAADYEASQLLPAVVAENSQTDSVQYVFQWLSFVLFCNQVRFKCILSQK
jgi:hypothetical protein